MVFHQSNRTVTKSVLKKNAFSTNSAEKTGYIHVKVMKLDLSLILYKNQLQMNPRL